MPEITSAVLGLEQINPLTHLEFPENGKPTISGTHEPKRDEDLFNLDLSKYDRYFPKGDIYYNEELELSRAKGQSGWEQFGAALNQMVVGEMIGGTFEGLGYLGDIQQTINAVQGDEQEWGNWLSDFGKSIREGAKELTPIYPDYEPGKFAPGNWSWWMTNAPTVGSTLSLLIPAAGVVKGASMIGKAAGIGAKMGKTAKWMATGISQAVVSRLMENGMEASNNFDEEYKRRLSEGMSEIEARQSASVSAAVTWNRNWVMLLQDVPQYLLLNGIGKGVAKQSIATAKAMAKPMLEPVVRTTGKVLLDIAGEGAEEAYQYIVSEEGKYISDLALDPSVKSRFADRFSTYLKDGDFWTNTFWGAMGAGAMHTVGRVINQSILKQKDPRVEDINSYSTKSSFWNRVLREAINRKDPIAREEAYSGLISTLAPGAVLNKNRENVIDFIDRMHEPSDEDLTNFKTERESRYAST